MANGKRPAEEKRRRPDAVPTGPPLTPNQLLAREGYKLGGIIGEGSYCKVREVSYNNERMAVKIISKEKASTEFLQKFLPREVSILQEISHSNIIKLFKVLDLPSHVYIFMELAERGDLLEYIRNRGRLSEIEARHYFSQLVCAVQYLHSRNITHRDLKCENILLGENNCIKLIDFGFCRKCVNPKTGRRLLSETYCGSTAYAAPEVLMGTPYNPMMYDLWSLGCILFIMVTGSMPFDDSNVKEMLRQQMRHKIRFPGTTHILSQDVKDLIRHMLEPDITKRATLDQVARSPWFVTTENTLNGR